MSTLEEAIVAALTELLRVLFSPIEATIETHADGLVRTIVGTPHPNAVLGRPTNPPWPGIYDYYWETLVPLALFLWGLAVGAVIFLEATGHLFSGYHRAKLKRRAVAGLLGVLSWWWLAALSLRLVHGLTGVIVPSLADLSLFQTLSFSAMGVLGTVLALAADFVLFVLLALLYAMRQLALYLFVLLMPLLLVFWVPGVGPGAPVARFMRRLAGFYVPILFMTVPVALLFRLGDLLGESFGLSMAGLGAWLTGLVLPLLALFAPFVFFWQAGTLFFMLDRVSHRLSRDRAGRRSQRAVQAGQTSTRGGRNFVRGARGKPTVSAQGPPPWQTDSRAHRAGVRLRRAVQGDQTPGNRDPTDRSPDTDAERATDFSNLREPPAPDEQPQDHEHHYGTHRRSIDRQADRRDSDRDSDSTDDTTDS
ncbi:MAG: hypothetical protein ABEH77_02700 [Halobacteriaceae archaeon]